MQFHAVLSTTSRYCGVAERPYHHRHLRRCFSGACESVFLRAWKQIAALKAADRERAAVVCSQLLLCKTFPRNRHPMWKSILRILTGCSRCAGTKFLAFRRQRNWPEIQKRYCSIDVKLICELESQSLFVDLRDTHG